MIPRSEDQNATDKPIPNVLKIRDNVARDHNVTRKFDLAILLFQVLAVESRKNQKQSGSTPLLALTALRTSQAKVG